MKRILLLLSTLIFTHTQLNAQSAKPGMKTFVNRKDEFYADKVGSRLPRMDKAEPLNNIPFDFSKIDKPTMLYFGFAGCPPCHFAMPLLIKTAAEKKYKEYNFIYITYDNLKTVAEELNKDPRDIKALHIMHMDRSEIDADRLTLGYPAIYYINSDGTVSYATGGGSTSDVFKTLEEWHTHLNILK